MQFDKHNFNFIIIIYIFHSQRRGVSKSFAPIKPVLTYVLNDVIKIMIKKNIYYSGLKILNLPTYLK